ncbi:cytochrome P450 [Lentinula detonsa]|uniref:Cytochrome P450 n=1 Tax=Lentinula detonsa TaxID=2804962 RepID=A0A9W8TX73_9AGAR|nr:cytochrome P450 [Lentinula detonsa]
MTDFMNFQFIGAAALFVIVLGQILRGKFKLLANVAGPDSASWVTGNFKQVFNSDAWGFHEFLAKKYGSMVRLHGPFGTKSLYTFDAKAMHTVLVKDQDVFEESDGFIESNLLIFGDGLLGTLGHRHRKQRKMLNPIFSAAHMREMMPTFFQLESALKNRLNKGPSTQEVDILSWMGRTALEIMGQAGLGYSFDPLTDEESAHPYSKIIKQLLPVLTRMQFWRLNILPYVSRIGTAGFRRFIIDILPWKDLHHLRDMIDYMHSIAEGIYQNKKRAFEMGDEAVAQQIGRGKDLISILMKENVKASNEDRLQDDEVIGQVIVTTLEWLWIDPDGDFFVSTLIFAAMDTTSSAMARLLHLLSRHPDVQDKLRRELIQAKSQNSGQDLSYKELTDLPYLDAVCRETLRLFAPASNVVRFARKDAVIPLHKPIIGIDGSEMREVAVPRGTTIFVSIFNANRNPDFWGEDANEWKPERWLSPLPESLVDARIPGVYSHLMTFIGGGRSCIGFKFSQLEMKVVISTLVESFNFSPSENDSKIFWQMNGVAAPIIGKDDHPQLPINISFIESANINQSSVQQHTI